MMNNTMIGREVKTESCLIIQNTCFLGLKPVLCSKVCAYYGHPNHCYIMFVLKTLSRIITDTAKIDLFAILNLALLQGLNFDIS